MTSPIRANAGLALKYQRALERLIDDMHKGSTRWIIAEYRRQLPKLTQDAPIRDLGDKLAEQAARWRQIFNHEAETLTGWFIGRVADVADRATKAALEKRLPTVKMNPSRAMNQVQAALIKENVSLIKTIQSKYFSDVEAAVMRSAAAGRDLQQLTDEIQARYQVTRNRAKLIAKDQNNKATMQMSLARQQSIGIEYGIWRHSHAGKEPRPSHKKADGVVFKLSEGLYLEDIGGEWAWITPGWAINCRCSWTPMIEGIDYPAGGVPDGYKPKNAA